MFDRRSYCNERIKKLRTKQSVAPSTNNQTSTPETASCRLPLNYSYLELIGSLIRPVRIERELSVNGHILCDIRNATAEDTCICLPCGWGQKLSVNGY